MLKKKLANQGENRIYTDFWLFSPNTITKKTKLLNAKHYLTTDSFLHFLFFKKLLPYKRFHSQLNSSNLIHSFYLIKSKPSPIPISYLRQWLHSIRALSLVWLVQPLEAQTVDVRVVNTEGVDLSAHSNVSLFPSIKKREHKQSEANKRKTLKEVMQKGQT